MEISELLALALNLVVGAWFIQGYPRLVRETSAPGHTPRAFTLLVPLVRGVGWLVIAGSLVYAALRLFGS